MTGPLDGLKVVEFASIGPGPFAAMMLADMGANVLRLVRPPANPGWESRDELTRSRASLSIDLKTSAGVALALELCSRSDVVLEGNRPGVMERLGMGPDQVMERNPRVVYGRMSGYGQYGPLANEPGHDINYIALSGALWTIGHREGGPVVPLNLVGDFGGGAMYLVVGVLGALFEAGRSGRGQVVDAAMVDGSASLLTMTHSFMNAGLWFEERESNILDGGAPFYNVYETKDEKYLAVGAIEPQFYSQLLLILGVDESTLPRQMDRESWPSLTETFRSILRQRTRADWVEAFTGYEACVTPVLSPSEAVEHPHNVARETFRNGLSGPVPQPAPRFSRTPASASVGTQHVGESARDLLRAWGLNEADVALFEAPGGETGR